MKNARRRASFIALEGNEGAGKSTQAELLTERFMTNGIPVISVQEPGTTPLGIHLREYLKSRRRIDPRAELLLFEASRAQLVAETIRPSLERGVTVVTDRFTASSMAYQSYGRRIGANPVMMLNDFATSGLHPDLNILLDLPPEEGLARTGGPQPILENTERAARRLRGNIWPVMKPQPILENTERAALRQDTAETRRFEDQPMRFHRRVRTGYLAQVKAEPKGWAMIHGRMAPEQVHQAIWERVEAAMGG